MTRYQEGKEKARAAAIEWQEQAAETAQSWNEIIHASMWFEKLAKRYGLKREFLENGIL